MGEYKGFVISIVLIVVIGTFMSLTASTFNIPVPEDTFAETLTTFIEDGINIFGIEISTQTIFGDTVSDFFVNMIVGLAIIPPLILYPLLTIILALFVYGLVKLLPFT